MSWRLLALLLLLLPVAAPAVPIQVAFAAAGFVPLSTPSDPPPDDPVSGRIVYEAASLTGPIQTLLSISLTIDGFTYAVSDVGFVNDWLGTTERAIGGLTTGVTGLTSGTDDFFLSFDGPTLQSTGNFTYTSGKTTQLGTYTGGYTGFSITQVPEPASIALLGFGIAALGGASRPASLARGQRLRRRRRHLAQAGTPPRPAPPTQSGQ